MSDSPSTKASRVLAALMKIGWRVSRQKGSHRRLVRPGWPPYTFAHHDGDEIGSKRLLRIGQDTGLSPADL